MKLSARLQDAFNHQINLEIGSAYIYKGMEQFFREEGLPQYAHFFNKHTLEELEHADDFKTFVEDVDGHIVYHPIEGVATEFASPREVFEVALNHEKLISASIINLLEIAIEEKHYAAENFLRTYVDEQVEEENLFRSLLDAIKHSGEKGASPFTLMQLLKHEEEDEE